LRQVASGIDSVNSLKTKYYFVQSLTLGRIPLILVFLVVTLLTDTRQSNTWFWTAFGAMILAGVTDLLDGFFARRFGLVSRLGAYADPLTDKVYFLTTFPALVYLAGLQGLVFQAHLLLLLAVLFLLRDQWVSFLRSIGALYNVDARANWSGKWRTATSFAVLCTIYYYLQAPRDWPLQLHAWLIYVLEALMMVLNLVSFWVYSVYYWPWLRKEIRLPGKDE
jgi:CDP-diacylglycerol--glycerol-3-phosphate 3-phosphatidyltransferase